MRKIIYISWFTLLILSCTTIGDLTVINDDIKNARSAYIEINNLFCEEEDSRLKFLANQKIVKEIYEDGTYSSTIYFTIKAGVKSYGIDKKFYIKTKNNT